MVDILHESPIAMRMTSSEWNGPDLVVFDMAGTTVQDLGQVPAALTAALAEQGIEVSAEELSNVRGSSKREAIFNFIPEGPSRERDAEAAFDAFKRHLTVRYQEQGVAPVPGAEPIFRFLRDQGVRVALNTGFDRMVTDLLLSALRWSKGVVDIVVCGDDVTHGRPAPDLILRAMEKAEVHDPSRVASVGDTRLDLEAGRHARVGWNIGVLSGAHDRPRLEKGPHTHLLPDVSHLRNLWTQRSERELEERPEPAPARKHKE